jgi:GNAT superfamily N-acetyltransferase
MSARLASVSRALDIQTGGGDSARRRGAVRLEWSVVLTGEDNAPLVGSAHLARAVAPMYAGRHAGETRRCERARMRTPDGGLQLLVQEPWVLRVGVTPLLVRPATPRDLAAVARMHARCTPRSLLDRYRAGGRPPAVIAVDRLLRQPGTVVAATPHGEVVATAALDRDHRHNPFCAEVGLLVEDTWQRLGIGTELLCHVAGTAAASGYRELIAYPATATEAAERLLHGVGRTRSVADGEPHLHTYLPESATLGLGAVRRRLAG